VLSPLLYNTDSIRHQQQFTLAIITLCTRLYTSILFSFILICLQYQYTFRYTFNSETWEILVVLQRPHASGDTSRVQTIAILLTSRLHCTPKKEREKSLEGEKPCDCSVFSADAFRYVTKQYCDSVFRNVIWWLVATSDDFLGCSCGLLCVSGMASAFSQERNVHVASCHLRNENTG